jgi:methyl-accepting chemotaxis protein
MQLDTVVQQNASSSEELAAMAEEMSTHSASLLENVSFFQMNSNAAGKKKAPARNLPEPAKAQSAPRTNASSAKPAARNDSYHSSNSISDSDFEEF